MTEYVVETYDPLTGNYVVVTAELYDDGKWIDYSDEQGSWIEIDADPVFWKYTYEDPETGACGKMPESWKFDVDNLLTNIYWDRELNR